MSDAQPLDVTTADGQFRFEGTLEEPSLLHIGPTGTFRRLLPGQVTERGVACVVHAFAHDLATARSRAAVPFDVLALVSLLEQIRDATKGKIDHTPMIPGLVAKALKMLEGTRGTRTSLADNPAAVEAAARAINGDDPGGWPELTPDAVRTLRELAIAALKEAERVRDGT